MEDFVALQNQVNGNLNPRVKSNRVSTETSRLPPIAMVLTEINRQLQATQTTSLDLTEQWVVNIVNFIRHHLKDVKKGWFNLDEVRGLKRRDVSLLPRKLYIRGVRVVGDETTWDNKCVPIDGEPLTGGCYHVGLVSVGRTNPEAGPVFSNCRLFGR